MDRLVYFKNNKIVSTVLIIFIILYITMAAPKLTHNAVSFFNNKYIKILFIFMIAYLACHDPIVSLIAAVAIFISLQTLRNYETTNYALKSNVHTLTDDELKHINVFNITNKIPKTNDIIVNSTQQISDSQHIISKASIIGDTNTIQDHQEIINNQNIKLDTAKKIDKLTTKLDEAKNNNDTHTVNEVTKEINKQTVKIDAVLKLDEAQSKLIIIKNNGDDNTINNLKEIINNKLEIIKSIDKSEELKNLASKSNNIITATNLNNEALMKEVKADALNKIEIYKTSLDNYHNSGNIQSHENTKNEATKNILIATSLLQSDKLIDEASKTTDFETKKKLLDDANNHNTIATAIIKSDINQSLANTTNDLTKTQLHTDESNKQILLANSLLKSQSLNNQSNIALSNGNTQDANNLKSQADLHITQAQSILNQPTNTTNTTNTTNASPTNVPTTAPTTAPSTAPLTNASPTAPSTNVSPTTDTVHLLEQCEKHYNESKNAELLGDMKLANMHMELFNQLKCNINDIMNSKKTNVKGFTFNNIDIYSEATFDSNSLSKDVLFETSCAKQEPYVKPIHEKINVGGFNENNEEIYAEINYDDHSKVLHPDYASSSYEQSNQKTSQYPSQVPEPMNNLEYASIN